MTAPARSRGTGWFSPFIEWSGAVLVMLPLLIGAALAIVLPMTCFTNDSSGLIDDPQVLIEKLVSPNKRPEITDDNEWDFEFPSDYDHEAQGRVDDALERLGALGTKAFPALVDHRNDERYCMTYPTAVYRNWSVGDMCVDIIGAQINAPSEYKGCAYYIGNKVKRDHLPEWWQERSAWTIDMLHREAVEWTIAEEARRAEKGESSMLGELAQDRADRLRAYREKTSASDEE